MKKVIAVLIICASLLLCSCGGGEVLKVASPDYKGLTELRSEEFDFEDAKNWIYTDHPNNGRECAVSKSDGGLAISAESENDDVFIEYFNSGYILGVDIPPHFDRWVKYITYNSSDIGDMAEMIEISKNQCRGIIRIDNDNGLILTSQDWFTDGMLIRAVNDIEKNDWRFEEIARFDGFPIAYAYENNELFIVTDQGIVAYRNGRIETIVESEILAASNPNSIVLIDDIIYCGTQGGIYSYNMTQNTETWYPIDYSICE